MAQIEVSAKFRLDKELTVEAINQVVRERFEKEFKLDEGKTAEVKKPGQFSISGRRKEGFFVTTCTFQADVNTRIQNGIALIRVDGSVKPIWAWYAMLIIGVVLIPVFVGIGIVVAMSLLYSFQRKQPQEVFQTVLENLKMEFGKI